MVRGAGWTVGDLWGNPLLDAIGASIVGYTGGWNGGPRRYYVVVRRPGGDVRATSRVSLDKAARTLARKIGVEVADG